MSTRVKTKSVSVEDLGSIVKQMVTGALENTAQVAKLHQAVYEEWYFKKLAELKGSEVKETEENFIQDVEQDNASEKNNLCESNHFSPSNISTNLTKENKSIELEVRSETFNSTIENTKFNSLIFLRDHRTSTEIKKTSSHATELQNVSTYDDAKHDLEIIEVWNNNKSQKTKLYKDVKHNPIKRGCSTQDSKTKCKDQNSTNRLAFETWKKQKNIKYKQLLRQEQKDRQKQYQAKLEEIESKRVAQTYMRVRKQETSQQKRKLSKEARVIGQTNKKSFQSQAEIKRIINDKVFKEWKRQKDIKLREQKMMNKAYQQQFANHFFHQQQQQLAHMDLLQNIDTKFNSWLNQLDWVLHEKYLRERRYLVRSFYCQPAYYGNAADIVYAKNSQ